MSADGEIEVAVKAEGVDDAAGEMGGDALAEGGDGGGGGMGGGGGGRLFRMLGSIVALLSVLRPVLEVLGTVSEVLEAFVAPLAVLLMRLLTPVLQLMLKILPAWLAWMDGTDADSIGAVIGQLLTGATLFLVANILRGLNELAARLTAWLKDSGLVGYLKGMAAALVPANFGLIDIALSMLPKRIWNYMSRLPGLIGQAIAQRLPDFGVAGGGGTSGASIIDALTNLATGDDTSGGGGAQVSIGGGLVPFIDNVTTDGRVDWP